jgi:hypothetical protein
MSIDLTVDRPRLCAFTFDDGRRCRIPRRSDHTLCHFHARKEAETRARQSAANKITYDISGECVTFRDVSAAIAHTISAVAHGHIKPKAAATIAYLCQSLVQSAVHAENEHIQAFGLQDWREEVAHSFNTASPAEPKVSPPASSPAENSSPKADLKDHPSDESGDEADNQPQPLDGSTATVESTLELESVSK